MIAIVTMLFIILMIIIGSFLIHYKFDVPGYIFICTGVVLLGVFPILVKMFNG